MMKHWRLLPLTLAALGCVSCASIKNTVSKINPFSKDDAPTESTSSDVAQKELKTDAVVPAAANDALMVVNVAGETQEVLIHLRPDLAPKHVANFKKLAAQEYFDGLAFHRAIRGYLVQSGDPLTRDDGNKVNWGTGGPEYKIPSEAKGSHKRGSIAAARLNDALNPDKGSSASQFYIMLRSAPSLNKDYTVFAEVTRGIEVVEQIAAQTVDTNDMPVKRVEIKSVRLLNPGDKALEAPKKTKFKTKPDSQKGAVTKFIERIW